MSRKCAKIRRGERSQAEEDGGNTEERYSGWAWLLKVLGGLVRGEKSRPSKSKHERRVWGAGGTLISKAGGKVSREPIK